MVDPVGGALRHRARCPCCWPRPAVASPTSRARSASRRGSGRRHQRPPARRAPRRPTSRLSPTPPARRRSRRAGPREPGPRGSGSCRWAPRTPPPPPRTTDPVTWVSTNASRRSGDSRWMASSSSSSPVRGASTRSASEARCASRPTRAAAAGAPADVVGADVAGDLQQPGAGRGVAPEAGQRGQGPEVHLLREVVGLGPVAQASAEPPHLRLGAAHERGHRHPVPLGRGQRQRGQVVHGSESGRPGTSRPSRATSTACDANRSARRSPPGSTVRRPSSDDAVLDAHLDACRSCEAWSEELTVLHRMVRVREAEPVPDLTAAILAAAPAAATARPPAPRTEPVSVARWALFVVALTQLVLAGARAAPRGGVGGHGPRRPRARLPSTSPWRSGSCWRRGSPPARGACSRSSRPSRS